ncbi:YHS domain-containing protein, partial [Acinetobacter baumannii]
TINDTHNDPVCGMAVTEESKFHEQVGNNTFYFCSEKCQIKFKHDPALYLAKEDGSAFTNVSLNKMEAQSNSINTSSIYTCPMHPEIRQNHPG